MNRLLTPRTVLALLPLCTLGLASEPGAMEPGAGSQVQVGDLTVTELLRGGNTFEGDGPIHVDAAGNVYVAGSDQILRIRPDGEVESVLDESMVPGIELSLTRGIAVDGSTLWVHEYGSLVKVTPSGTSVFELPEPGPYARWDELAVDGSGNAYVIRDDYDDFVLLRVNLLRIAPDGETSEVVLYDVTVDSPPLFTAEVVRIAAFPNEPGKIAVVIQEARRVLVVSPDGSIEELAAPGSGLSWPWDVDVDADGNVFVADNDGVFDVSGEGVELLAGGGTLAIAVNPCSGHLFVLGTPATFQGGRLREITPEGVTLRDVVLGGIPNVLGVDCSGNVYSIWQGPPRVGRVAPDNTWTELLDRTGDGSAILIGNPRGLAVGPMGDIFLAESYYGRFFRLAPSGEVTTLAFGDFPNDVAVDAVGNAYLVDTNDSRVVRMDPSGGSVTLIDASGDGSHPLTRPCNVALDSANNMYVAGSFSHNAFRVSPSGEIEQIIDLTGDGVNVLSAPRSIAVDGEGNVYVGGASSHNVFKITPAGEITEILDFTGDGTSSLDQPWDLCVDGAGNVYTTGYISNNLFRVSPSGVIEELVDQSADGLSELRQPRGVTAAPNGSVFVVGGSSWNVLEVRPDGTVVEVVTSHTLGPDSLRSPWEIESDVSGNVFLTGNESGNLIRISPPACAAQPAVRFRNGGTNPPSYTVTPASIGASLDFTVNLATTGHSQALVIGFDSPFELTLAGGQTLLCLDLLGSGGELINTGFFEGPLATTSLAVPADPSLIGFTMSTQALHAFGAVPFALSNAQDVVIGGCP